MNKTGGIISIIAGIFGVIASITTLFVGGMGSAFDADGSSQIIGFGWGGVLFSFLVIIFGALAFSKPKFSGYAIIVSSLFGAVLGGTFVAICMALSVIGGILTLFGKNDSKQINVSERTDEAAGKKKRHWMALCFIVIAVIIVLANIGENDSNKSPAIDPLAELEQESVSDLKPQGELASMFAFGSNNTDLQRENKLKEITGKVIQWQLPVYDVKRSGNGYIVQTHTDLGVLGTLVQNVVGTFIYVTPRNDQDKQVIEELKTGDIISFKGRISDSTMRNLDIKPAILVLSGESAQSSKEVVDEASSIDQTNTEQQAQQPIVTEEQLVPDSEPTELKSDIKQPIDIEESPAIKDEKITWTGNWGNDILATLTTDQCSDDDFLKQGYKYFASSSIPISRLKKPSYAWFVSNERAITVIGCWFKKEGGLIHLKMKRKQDGKIWEQDHNLEDGSWTSHVIESATNEEIKQKAKDALDEANKQINIVWNATTKGIRAAMLPEQREWIKQRENDCGLKASTEEPNNVILQDTIRFNCMASMTNQRTEVLKQKIAAMTRS